MAMIIAILLIANTAFSLACITMSNNANWKDAKMTEGEEGYFSLLIYNTSADGRICDTGEYSVEIELQDIPETNVEELFDYTIEPQLFELSDGETKQVLITLTPKVESGNYKIKATAKKLPPQGGGTKMIYTTSAFIHTTIGTEKNHGEIPFWVIRKDCPDGTVITKGEECPKPENKNMIAGLININIEGGDMMLIGLALFILSLVLVGAWFMINKKPTTQPTGQPAYDQYDKNN